MLNNKVPLIEFLKVIKKQFCLDTFLLEAFQDLGFNIPEVVEQFVK